MKTKLTLIALALLFSIALFSIIESNEILTTNDFTISPNPFKTTTTITVQLTQSEDMVLQILDNTNKVVKVIYSGTMETGLTSYTWDGTDDNGIRLQKGKYDCELVSVARYTSIKKIIILK